MERIRAGFNFMASGGIPSKPGSKPFSAVKIPSITVASSPSTTTSGDTRNKDGGNNTSEHPLQFDKETHPPQPSQKCEPKRIQLDIAAIERLMRMLIKLVARLANDIENNNNASVMLCGTPMHKLRPIEMYARDNLTSNILSGSLPNPTTSSSSNSGSNYLEDQFQNAPLNMLWLVLVQTLSYRLPILPPNSLPSIIIVEKEVSHIPFDWEAAEVSCRRLLTGLSSVHRRLIAAICVMLEVIARCSQGDGGSGRKAVDMLLPALFPAVFLQMQQPNKKNVKYQMEKAYIHSRKLLCIVVQCSRAYGGLGEYQYVFSRLVAQQHESGDRLLLPRGGPSDKTMSMVHPVELPAFHEWLGVEKESGDITAPRTTINNSDDQEVTQKLSLSVDKDNDKKSNINTENNSLHVDSTSLDSPRTGTGRGVVWYSPKKMKDPFGLSIDGKTTIGKMSDLSMRSSKERDSSSKEVYKTSSPFEDKHQHSRHRPYPSGNIHGTSAEEKDSSSSRRSIKSDAKYEMRNHQNDNSTEKGDYCVSMTTILDYFTKSLTREKTTTHLLSYLGMALDSEAHLPSFIRYVRWSMGEEDLALRLQRRYGKQHFDSIKWRNVEELCRLNYESPIDDSGEINLYDNNVTNTPVMATSDEKISANYDKESGDKELLHKRHHSSDILCDLDSDSDGTTSVNNDHGMTESNELDLSHGSESGKFDSSEEETHVKSRTVLDTMHNASKGYDKQILHTTNKTVSFNRNIESSLGSHDEAEESESDVPSGTSDSGRSASASPLNPYAYGDASYLDDQNDFDAEEDEYMHPSMDYHSIAARGRSPNRTITTVNCSDTSPDEACGASVDPFEDEYTHQSSIRAGNLLPSSLAAASSMTNNDSSDIRPTSAMSARKKKLQTEANNLLAALGSGIVTRDKSTNLLGSITTDKMQHYGDKEQQVDEPYDVFSFGSFLPPAVSPPPPKPRGQLDVQNDMSSDSDRDSNDYSDDNDGISNYNGDFEMKRRALVAKKHEVNIDTDKTSDIWRINDNTSNSTGETIMSPPLHSMKEEYNEEYDKAALQSAIERLEAAIAVSDQIIVTSRVV